MTNRVSFRLPRGAPGAGGQRTRPQHGHRREHDPEPVLHWGTDAWSRPPGRDRVRCARCSAPPPRARRQIPRRDAGYRLRLRQHADGGAVSGSSRPSTRCSTGRASAAAAPAMTRPVIATVAPKVRRSSSRWPTATAAASSGSPRSSAMSRGSGPGPPPSDRSARRRARPGRARGRPPGSPQQPGAGGQDPHGGIPDVPEPAGGLSVTRSHSQPRSSTTRTGRGCRRSGPPAGIRC